MESRKPVKTSSRGGRRPGAGRKSVIGRKMASHKARPRVRAKTPVHITMRMRPEIGSIRAVRVRKFLVASFAEAETRRFRVRRYSIQKNHLHLICDAKSTEALASGMQGLNIRIARGLNRIMDRRGAVLDGRYHVEILDRGDLARDAVCFFDEKNRPCAGLTEWAEIPDEDRPEHPRP